MKINTLSGDETQIAHLINCCCFDIFINVFGIDFPLNKQEWKNLKLRKFEENRWKAWNNYTENIKIQIIIGKLLPMWFILLDKGISLISISHWLKLKKFAYLVIMRV